MKNSILFSLLAAILLTSACGSDSKKSQPKSTVYHFNTGHGYCLEVVQEQLAAKGFELPDTVSAGACPQQTTIPGPNTVTRHATCPITMENGAPGTAVFYTKMIDDEGGVLDLTVMSPEFICQEVS
ncbi:hypothetical protein [Oligoflexus tunisiensis]|uniref:hypothetical protein n=1 Tax=Oligoflexus tunisiensis TaxID=708132 RepID=UPI00114CCE1B|nr:hypothetical protein [Oligoflexus tunisiensis]